MLTDWDFFWLGISGKLIWNLRCKIAFIYVVSLG